MDISSSAAAIAPSRPLPHRAACQGIAALLIAAAPAAWSHTPEVVIARPHPTGNVHNHAEQTWPPQPKGIKNAVQRGGPAAAEARAAGPESRFGEVELRGGGRDDFVAALGRQYTRVSVTDLHDKSGKKPGSRYTYFSRSRNATVQVLFDGNDITAVQSIPAVEYQPEIVDEESAEAIRLARSHFLNLGRPRVAALKGYAILAYRPEGKGFYDSRVLYVSFHARDDSPPQLVAWVDLSSQSVLKYREERQ